VGANASGAATVFERAGDGTWHEVASLAPTPAVAKAHFGAAVALDGERLAVGAPSSNAPLPQSGLVHVFERAGDGSWVEAQVLALPTPGSLARFGEDVALVGDTLVAGAPGLSSVVSADGAVGVFERDASGAFVHTSTLVQPTNEGGARFGSDVALVADRLAVGAPLGLSPSDGSRTGAVHVFGASSNGWQALDVVHGPWPESRFGDALALVGDEVASGAALADVFGTDSGAALSFRVVAAPPDVLLVDAAATGADCNDPWDLAFDRLEEAVDAAIADPTKREIWVAAGSYRLSSTTTSAPLPNGLRILGGFPSGGGTLAQRDPATHRTVLARAEALGPPLKASFYSNVNLSGSPVLVQNVANIDNDWAMTSPIGQIDNFSIRWEGFVTSPQTSPVAFHTTTDDGVRLWVNNVLVIDKWIDQSATEHTGTIPLTAGVPVPIRMEFYEKGGDAVAKLAWTLLAVPKEIVPTSAFSSGTASRIARLDGIELELDGLVLEDATVASSDSDTTGGAVRLVNGARLVLRNCVVEGNTAVGAGGAVRADGGSQLVLVDCDVRGNSTSSTGGAVSLTGVGTRLDAVATRFVGNTSLGIGGAVHVAGGAAAALVDCVLDGNTAGNSTTTSQEGGGAAVVGLGSLLEVAHSTVVANAAPGGAGLGGGLVARTEATLRVANSILWDNTGAGQAQGVNQVRATNAACVTVEASTVQGWTGGVVNSTCASGVVLAQDPLLDAERAPGLGSPAVDAGSTDLVPLDALDLDGDGDVLELLPRDLRGRPRRHDHRLALDTGSGAHPLPDQGAFERGAPPSVEAVDCAQNPAGSLSVASGSAGLGDTLVLRLVDPTATIGAGAAVVLALGNDVASVQSPCGDVYVGLGLGAALAPGALVVGGDGLVLLFGDALPAAGAATDFALDVPSDPSFAGVSVVVQGLFVDGAAGKAGLSSALLVALGAAL
jgi:nitrogen fixation protein